MYTAVVMKMGYTLFFSLYNINETCDWRGFHYAEKHTTLICRIDRRSVSVFD